MCLLTTSPPPQCYGPVCVSCSSFPPELCVSCSSFWQEAVFRVPPFGLSPGCRGVPGAAGCCRVGLPGHWTHSVAQLPSHKYIPIAPWLRRASPGPWWSTEKAFRTRSSRLLAKAEALSSIGYKSTIDVDDGSTGGNRLEAVSRPRTAGCSETPDRGGQS